MLYIFALTIFAAATLSVRAEIPEYIHVCNRNDPKVEDCILRSIEDIRPRLEKGIPALSVPGLEPLLLGDVEIANGQDSSRLRIYGHDVKVRGGSQFKVNKLKLDLSRENALVFHVDLTLPHLDVDGDYELNAKLLILPLNGRGQIHVNVSNAHADAIITGQLYKKGNKNYIRFTKVDMQLDMDDFDIALNNLFNGEKTLSQVANTIIRDNKHEFGKTLNPIIARTVSKVILDIANKVTKNNPYDELFPKGKQ